jgi:hypothetical protein
MPDAPDVDEALAADGDDIVGPLSEDQQPIVLPEGAQVADAGP